MNANENQEISNEKNLIKRQKTLSKDGRESLSGLSPSNKMQNRSNQEPRITKDQFHKQETFERKKSIIKDDGTKKNKILNKKASQGAPRILDRTGSLAPDLKRQKTENPKKDDKTAKSSPTCGLFSFLLFRQFSPIFSISSRRKIEMEDMSPIPPAISMKNIKKRVECLLKLKQEAGTQVRDFWEIVIAMIKPFLLKATILKCLEQIVVLILTVLLLNFLPKIKQKMKEEVHLPTFREILRQDFTLYILIPVCGGLLAFTQFVIREHSAKFVNQSVSNSNQILRTLLFRKLAAVNMTFLRNADSSLIMRLSIFKFESVVKFIGKVPDLAAFPLMLVLSLILMSSFVSLTTLVSFAIFLVTTVILVFLMRKLTIRNLKYEFSGSLRSAKIDEMLKKLEQIKSESMEILYKRDIKRLRKREVSYLNRVYTVRAIASLTMSLSVICNTVLIILMENSRRKLPLTVTDTLSIVSVTSNLQKPLRRFVVLLESYYEYTYAKKCLNNFLFSISDKSSTVEVDKQLMVGEIKIEECSTQIEDDEEMVKKMNKILGYGFETAGGEQKGGKAPDGANIDENGGDGSPGAGDNQGDGDGGVSQLEVMTDKQTTPKLTGKRAGVSSPQNKVLSIHGLQGIGEEDEGNDEDKSSQDSEDDEEEKEEDSVQAEITKRRANLRTNSMRNPKISINLIEESRASKFSSNDNDESNPLAAPRRNAHQKMSLPPEQQLRRRRGQMIPSMKSNFATRTTAGTPGPPSFSLKESAPSLEDSKADPFSRGLFRFTRAVSKLGSNLGDKTKTLARLVNTFKVSAGGDDQKQHKIEKRLKHSCMKIHIKPKEKIFILSDTEKESGSDFFLDLLGESEIAEGSIKLNGKIVHLDLKDFTFLTGETIRDNILMRTAFNRAQYTSVLRRSELDTTKFPRKDKTMVMDSGENLSVEDLKKILLARALYANGDIYLIDGCGDDENKLADNESSVSLFSELNFYKLIVQRVLMNKTVIMIGSNDFLVDLANRSIYFEDGILYEIDNIMDEAQEYDSGEEGGDEENRDGDARGQNGRVEEDVKDFDSKAAIANDSFFVGGGGGVEGMNNSKFLGSNLRGGQEELIAGYQSAGPAPRSKVTSGKLMLGRSTAKRPTGRQNSPGLGGTFKISDFQKQLSGAILDKRRPQKNNIMKRSSVMNSRHNKTRRNSMLALNRGSVVNKRGSKLIKGKSMEDISLTSDRLPFDRDWNEEQLYDTLVRSVLRYLFTLGTGRIVGLMIGMTLTAMIILALDIWVGAWGANLFGLTSNTYRTIYILLSLFSLSAIAFRNSRSFHTLIRNSNKIHNKVFSNLLNIDVLWLYSNPSTRIGHLMAYDIKNLDHLNVNLIGSIEAFTMLVVGIVLINYVFFGLYLILVLLLWVYVAFNVRRYVRATQRFIKFIAENACIVQEVLNRTLDETLSFRLTDKVNVIEETFMQACDEYQRSLSHLGYFSKRWLGIRLGFFYSILVLMAFLIPVLYIGILRNYLSDRNILEYALAISWSLRSVGFFETMINQFLKSYEQICCYARMQLFIQSSRQDEDRDGDGKGGGSQRPSMFPIKILEKDENPKIPKNSKKLVSLDLSETKKQLLNLSEGNALPRKDYAFEIKNLALKEKSEILFEKVNLSIEKGTKCAIIGVIESGKADLIRVLAREKFKNEKEEADSFSLLGREITSYTQKELSGLITELDTDPIVFGGTIRDNIDPARTKTDDELAQLFEDFDIFNILSDFQKDTYLFQEGEQALNEGSSLVPFGIGFKRGSKDYKKREICYKILIQIKNDFGCDIVLKNAIERTNLGEILELDLRTSKRIKDSLQPVAATRRKQRTNSGSWKMALGSVLSQRNKRGSNKIFSTSKSALNKVRQEKDVLLKIKQENEHLKKIEKKIFENLLKQKIGLNDSNITLKLKKIIKIMKMIVRPTEILVIDEEALDLGDGEQRFRQRLQKILELKRDSTVCMMLLNNSNLTLFEEFILMSEERKIEEKGLLEEHLKNSDSRLIKYLKEKDVKAYRQAMSKIEVKSSANEDSLAQEGSEEIDYTDAASEDLDELDDSSFDDLKLARDCIEKNQHRGGIMRPSKDERKRESYQLAVGLHKRAWMSRGSEDESSCCGG